MSESLRDQLLKAGFTEATPARKKPKHPKKTGQKKKKKPAAKHAAQAAKAPAVPDAAELAAQAERKRIKAEIKTLIEAECVNDYQGEFGYNYQFGERVRQLFIKPELQPKLAARELAITRLNGNTYLIPPETAEKVLALNPEWAVIFAPEDKPEALPEEYKDHPIPDDLIW
ncbi:DUF2058 family protein [Granulosicoccaceae sp. 1_MG-2023]|nr:DUF2058 family protein [Granulosicoccaceae sp. 1_MG-2023]